MRIELTDNEVSEEEITDPSEGVCDRNATVPSESNLRFEL